MSIRTLAEFHRKAKKLSRLLPNGAYRRGLYHGIGAAIEHESALAALDIRTVVDIGANVGQFSLLATSIYPDARIYAFEPQPQPATRFSALFSDIERVTLFRFAVGTQSGKIAMHVSRQNDSSSLLPISQNMTEIFPGTDEIGITDVEIAPLLSFLKPEQIVGPALLKIDVQGAELDVLLGCRELLKFFRYVYAELSFVELYTGQALCHDVVRFLGDHDLYLAGIYNQRQDVHGRAIQADFLFLRSSQTAGLNS